MKRLQAVVVLAFTVLVAILWERDALARPIICDVIDQCVSVEPYCGLSGDGYEDLYRWWDANC